MDSTFRMPVVVHQVWMPLRLREQCSHEGHFSLPGLLLIFPEHLQKLQVQALWTFKPGNDVTLWQIQRIESSIGATQLGNCGILRMCTTGRDTQDLQSFAKLLGNFAKFWNLLDKLRTRAKRYAVCQIHAAPLIFVDHWHYGHFMSGHRYARREAARRT